MIIKIQLIIIPIQLSLVTDNFINDNYFTINCNNHNDQQC